VSESHEHGTTDSRQPAQTTDPAKRPKVPDSPTHRWTGNQHFLHFFVAVTGAAVMSLELTASRFLAPYFGTSMIVWANIIGLILLSMSIGYWLGGRVASRHPRPTVLFTLALGAGLWTSLLPVFGQAVFQHMSGGILNTPVMTILLSFFSILLVFAPPVLILAMVSPLALYFAADKGDNTGKMAGNLYAFSTLGSLLGTFGTAFGTIPFWGTRATLLAWSGALVVISVLGLIVSQSRRAKGYGLIGLLLFVPAMGSDVLIGPAQESPGTVFAKDTLYQFVRVIRGNSGTTYLVYNEGGGVQSIHRPLDALGSQDYYDDYLVLPDLISPERGEIAGTGGTAGKGGLANSVDATTGAGPRVLVLGAAGGTIPTLFSHYDKSRFPGMQITGVEIDPAVIPLAYKYFGLRPGDATMVNQDARVFIRSTTAKYDLIIIDAYTQQIYIPFHLTTVEFFQELRSRITSRGIVALNVNAVSPNSKLLLAMEKTVQTDFPHTYLMKARGLYNYVLVGSTHPLQVSNLDTVPTDSPLYPIVNEWKSGLRPVSSQALVHVLTLTDDRAPTEMLTDQMVLGFLRTGESP